MKANERKVYEYLQRYLTAVWDAKYVDSIRGSLAASGVLREIDDAGLTDQHIRALERYDYARRHYSYDSYSIFERALQGADRTTATTEGDSTFMAFIDTNTGPYRRYIVLNMGVWYE
ncbi:MAG: hypothetical protein GOVbin1923_41 [Prokaryotic dsDNA virus sp.]|nr:MAG: hypothetical protein GOVbin1923_41 [Prokaryotic dsDNA virus sp.]